MVDLICMGLLELQGVQNKNNKMKNTYPQRYSNSRPLDLEATTASIMPSDLIYYRQATTKAGFTCAVISYIITRCREYRVFSIVPISFGQTGK